MGEAADLPDGAEVDFKGDKPIILDTHVSGLWALVHSRNIK